MSNDPQKIMALTWPASRLGEAIEYLGQKAGYLSHPAEIPTMPQSTQPVDDETLDGWLNAITNQLGLEVEAIQATYSEADQLVRYAAPAILRLPDNHKNNQPRFLVLLKSGWRRMQVIGPDMTVRRLFPQQIRAALCHPIEAPFSAQINHLLSEAGVTEQRQDKARAAILKEQLGSMTVGGGWLLRLPPGTNIWKQAWHARLLRPTLTVISGQVIQQLLSVFSWYIIGRAVFSGKTDSAWMLAWALVLFTAIPFQLLMTWAQSDLAIKAGRNFKQRLLFGTLKLEPEEIRHQGAGQFLGRVMESEAVEMLALTGGFMAVLAVIELVIAGAILAAGAGGWLHVLLLGVWVLIALLIGWRYYKHNYVRIDAYRTMTNDLVEGMVGHRTRLAQEEHRHWHDREDQALAQYVKLMEQVDRVGIQLSALIPRGWLFLGLAGIAYVFIINPTTAAELAISLGGIILAHQALTSLMGGMGSVIQFIITWGQVKPLFQAAARQNNDQAIDIGLAVTAGRNKPKPGYPLLAVRDIAFRYRDYGKPVLENCSLHINSGDRLLLEGPSGGGKSTLAAILAGLRTPESGLMLWQGLDQQTIGLREWRQHVVAAPQFHENHVFTETFAFNLLMGRQWPATPDDLAEAEIVCRQLGLGYLLDSMPAGFQQMVGESGWQLSHGERSRLYIARALLQRADLIILDESFAALDPENLRRTLQTVLNQAPTLIVVAHP